MLRIVLDPETELNENTNGCFRQKTDKSKNFLFKIGI
jgi:hypothetical protein